MVNINQYAESNLTLVNESGEVYPADELTTLIHNNKGITLRWKANRPFNHILPFTHAVVHRGLKVLSVVPIRPLDNSTVGTELELHV